MKGQPKIIAFYLPQFHVIPENNKWWGDGFTEWTNVKSAKSLFKSHNQPRIPLDSNYYNLKDIEVMKWQAKLAKEYGVDAFCYYHYWFNGKKLLEFPLENMLLNKDVDISFCLSWANEPWARTWDGRDTDILMPQKYGSETEWTEHFQYLMNFFKDDRYLKIDNKPMMVIYRTSNIPEVDKMIIYWDELAKNNGFDGIHIVETLNSREKESFAKHSAAVVEFEPSYTLHHKYALKYRVIDWIKKKLNGINIQDYDNIYRCIINREIIETNKNRYLGAFVDWDNSPRKKRKALIIKKSSPEKFEKYLRIQFYKAIENKLDFIFINAWNEWAEGTYLEPDTIHEYSYLKALRRAISKDTRINK